MSHTDGRHRVLNRGLRMETHHVYIREAVPDDNDELQILQAQCPQGTRLVLSAVFTPDFFARVKPYENSRVFVACEGERIIGSAACAVRDAFVNGQVHRVGYGLQGFVSRDWRRKGVGGRLHQHCENYLRQQGVALFYALVLEGNLPVMRGAGPRDFRLHRTLVMPIVSVYREMKVPSQGNIRLATYEDLPAVANLLNDTWRGYDMYGPTTAEKLAAFIERTPAYTLDNLLIVERGGEVVACLGFWDWSRIARITVEALSSKLRVIGLMVNIARHFRQMPSVPEVGAILKQYCLTPIAFKTPENLTALFRYVNNLALNSGVGQMFCLSERKHPLLGCMKGLFRTNLSMHLYVKPFQKILLGDNPVFLDGVDL